MFKKQRRRQCGQKVNPLKYENNQKARKGKVSMGKMPGSNWDEKHHNKKISSVGIDAALPRRRT